MKKLFLAFIITTFANYFIACNKSNSPSTQPTYQKLVLGKWVYAHSNKYDSVFASGGFATHTQSSNLDSNHNYLLFTDSNILYSVQYGWGAGMSGTIYNDTVHYTIVGNNIFLSWPAGINMYAGPTTFTYPTYQDTIVIKSLTESSFTLTRNYHFKHFIVNSGEVKQSIDSLIR
ncbi:MAG: hypothetical protein EKK39_14510 [Sphingobacteriales bacterium]|uniref:hypothetical protein n=1 Tax=Hydrotalea flava TaxID=714549 RepID=UPI0008298BBF|nr:hypothetical protein [Hydrotalea flava]RTL47326.1 MAG: hypothetical protein EKK39_14510 [Sphingobacteriales bacterium]